jgi:hypothetical protein
MQYDLMDVGKSYKMLGGKQAECHFEGVHIRGTILKWISKKKVRRYYLN